MNPKFYELNRKILHMKCNNVDNLSVKDCRMNYYFRKQLKANGIDYTFYRQGIRPGAAYGTLVIEKFNICLEFQDLNYTQVSVIGIRGYSFTLRADCINELWDKMLRFKIINRQQYFAFRIHTELLAAQQSKCSL